MTSTFDFNGPAVWFRVEGDLVYLPGEGVPQVRLVVSRYRRGVVNPNVRCLVFWMVYWLGAVEFGVCFQ
jgi:hypothetical protein